jgi:hypothetical protein
MANNIKGDVSHHIEDLTRTAKMHMTHHNQNPTPCVRTNTAMDMLERVRRGQEKLLHIQST